MKLLIIMALGILIGAFIIPIKFKKWNEKLQIICITLLIFTMGLSLGRKDGFLHDLAALGFDGFLFAVIPIACSTIAVYWLTKYFFEKKHK